MQKPTLLILAAGMGSRYGGLKQVDALGPNGEALIEFSIYDAIRAGFGKVVFVIRQDIEAAFKEKIGNQFADKIEVQYAFQEIDSPIKGISSFPEREKPWGTAHAMLVAQDKIQEPFAVINADDYYGISGFQTMADFLQQSCSPKDYSMVAYQLENTLSDNGHVNRGVCGVDEHGHLTDVVERLKIRRTDKGVVYEEEGKSFPLSEKDLVSMNFWGFHPNIFEITRKEFIAFVEANKDKPRAEFFIPLVVNKLIQSGAIHLHVLSNDEQWYGVTYQEDKPKVQAAFQQMVKEGKYPPALWA
ncbi:MAG TPA: sugar phosphate nucleotidyltransferase [Saprospiraceae bacterium]|nr:sugar phosphate nucleotidyltransferase [Saprospiraceae bacterium]